MYLQVPYLNLDPNPCNNRLDPQHWPLLTVFFFFKFLARSKPVTCEPLFKMWKYADRESVRSRITAMVKIWTKNINWILSAVRKYADRVSVRSRISAMVKIWTKNNNWILSAVVFRRIRSIYYPDPSSERSGSVSDQKLVITSQIYLII
jgi:hypothetical protein